MHLQKARSAAQAQRVVACVAAFCLLLLSSSSLVVFRGVDDFFNAEKLLFFRIDTAALSVRPASFRHHHEARKNAEKKKNHNRTTDRPSKGEQRSFFALRFMEFLRSC